MSMTSLRASLALLLTSVATFVLAHGDETHPMPMHRYDPAHVDVQPFGREGDPARVDRVIRVDMSDAFRFDPAEVTIRRGQTVRFIVSNHGRQLHEMVLGTSEALKAHAALMRRFPNMEHADANMTHVKPGATGEIVWQFDQPGAYQFACLIPGHFEAGMVGQLIVQ